MCYWWCQRWRPKEGGSLSYWDWTLCDGRVSLFCNSRVWGGRSDRRQKWMKGLVISRVERERERICCSRINSARQRWQEALRVGDDRGSKNDADLLFFFPLSPLSRFDVFSHFSSPLSLFYSALSGILLLHLFHRTAASPCVPNFNLLSIIRRLSVYPPLSLHTPLVSPSASCSSTSRWRLQGAL